MYSVCLYSYAARILHLFTYVHVLYMNSQNYLRRGIFLAARSIPAPI